MSAKYSLGNCCQLIDYDLRTREEYRTIPREREIFVWNEISDKEEQTHRMLHFLKLKFNLKDTEFNNIKSNKDSNTIIVKTSINSAPIILRLDEKRDKVIMSSTDENNQYKEYEYDVEYIGSRDCSCGTKDLRRKSVKEYYGYIEKGSGTDNL